MNETLIFFKIQGVHKKISCILKKMNQSIENETVFTNLEMNNERNFNFLLNSSLDIQCTYSNKLVKKPPKLIAIM